MPEYALELSEAELFRYQKMAELALSTERELWSAAGIVEGASVASRGGQASEPATAFVPSFRAYGRRPAS
ncbi:MAG: hypothetical protein CYG61_03730 [Actinobacteria bacterium]|nr:MAG: hypothetical protein CYG61_03730 [Actinomycetota bacterium]